MSPLLNNDKDVYLWPKVWLDVARPVSNQTDFISYNVVWRLQEE